MEDKIEAIMAEIDQDCYENGDCGAFDIIKIEKILRKHLTKEESKPVVKIDKLIISEDMTNREYNTATAINQIMDYLNSNR